MTKSRQLGFLGLAIAVAMLTFLRNASPAQPALQLRTLLVVDRGQARPHATARGVEVVVRLSGTAPRRLTAATVLTDTSCAPDRLGVSHCHNTLALASGRLLVVRHDHSMRTVPCLAPGEHVRVARYTAL